MTPQQQDWIEANVEGDGYAQCEQKTLEMQQAFPELRRVKGIYRCWAWGERTHWWLVAADGSVVDPTRMQFPSRGMGRYEELQDDQLADRLPVGKCMNCGKDIYEKDDAPSDQICSDECGADFVEYLNTPMNI